MSILGVTHQNAEICSRQAEQGRMAVAGMERLGWGEKRTRTYKTRNSCFKSIN
jgi:hypothetical protein